MTNVLKMIVKCCDGGACNSEPLPLSISNIFSPENQTNKTFIDTILEYQL